MKRFIAKLTAFMLVLNLAVCVPVSAYAEEGESFVADSVTMDAQEGTTTVTESVEMPVPSVTPPESSEASGSTQTPVPTQSVSVAFDTEQALTEEPAGEAQVSEDGTAIEYETSDRTAIEESFDLDVKITATETDGEGNLTDITYEVSLDQQTENGTDTTVTKNVDQVWAAEGSEEIKVELSVNGMVENPTRVEHIYKENGESKTEYYYNEANKTEGDTDTDKKYFTVETVKDAAETVVNKVVSLWTSFLGIFKVTNDAFENQDDMSTSATLDDAVNSAADGSTVEMLRDYSTADRAILANGEGKGGNITVDLNGHTYEKTGGSVAVDVYGNGQNVTFKDGTIEGSEDGIYVGGSNNGLTLDNVDVESKASNGYGIYSTSNSANAKVEVTNGSSVSSGYTGIYLKGTTPTLTVDDSTVKGSSYAVIDYSNGATVNIQKGSSVSSEYTGMYLGSETPTITVDNSTVKGSSYAVIDYSNGATVNIQNGSSVSSGYTGMYIDGTKPTITVDNSTVITNGSGQAIIVYSEGAKVNIQKGSTINAVYFGVQMQGDKQELTVADSSVNISENGYGLLIMGSGSTLNMSGTNVASGYNGVYSTGNGHIININKSTFNAKSGVFSKGDGHRINIGNSKFYGANCIYNGTSNSMLTIVDSLIDASERGVEINLNNSRATIERTTINADDIGIADFGIGNIYLIQDCSINYGASFGITHNGNCGGAQFKIIGSYIKPVTEGGVGIYISGQTENLNGELGGLNSLTLKDTEVVGNTAVEVKFTDVTVDGGRLSGVGVPPGYEENSNGATTIGTALAVTDNTDGKTGGTILINSGYFMGAKDFDSIFQTVKESTGDDKASVTIVGGHYTHPDGLYKFIAENHAAVCYEDGSKYQYEVVPAGFVPSRAGYHFAGYRDADGNPITLAEAYRDKKVAYINWTVVVDVPDITEGNKPQDIIVVEPDANDSSVQIEFNGSTANVTVNAPTGEKTEISEVTVTSVQTLRDSGIDTISISVDKTVTLEMDITESADNGLGDRVVVRRDESTLTITDEENVQLNFELDGLKSEVESSVHIHYAEGVVTIYFDSAEVFRVEVMEAVKANKEITFRLENGVLKLFDKSGKLIQEIAM